MKGPGLRIDNDVRRVWCCPACGKESRAAGDVVSLACGCTRDGVVMKLVEGRRQVRAFPRPATVERPTASEESQPSSTSDLETADSGPTDFESSLSQEAARATEAGLTETASMSHEANRDETKGDETKSPLGLPTGPTSDSDDDFGEGLATE